ncbi:leucyl/phenylalanyl-tRNA--protein transferase [Cellulophaga sp. HaHaR_3_176]|nr:leucyl/phenylalanyl-tRNA--protein transferase [Cellulophaga sp. HaHaR_3_176]
MVLEPNSLYFPPVENADEEGLLAYGGDLSPERLLLAYKSGIFPWFNEDSLILWWSPNPRMVLFPKKIKISKSMKKVLKSTQFKLTKNTCFQSVLDNCSAIEREGQEGTWITSNMKTAYLELHKRGVAESYEVWEDEELVGGLYGINLGDVFCGESMFSLVSNASKFAFIHLAKELQENNYKLIDCQVYTEHLESLGAEEISRQTFISYL